VGDDVVQHLTTVHIFEKHIPMIRGPDHVPHATDVWVVHEGHNGSFSGGSNLL
jgi:hypothetical protein